MKKMKFLVLLSALVTMLGFSSCLDDGDGVNSITMGQVMRVGGYKGSYYFTNAANQKVVPSNQSDIPDLSGSFYAFVYFMYDPTAVPVGTNEVTAQIMALTAMVDGTAYPRLPGEGDANAPVKYVDYNAFIQTCGFFGLTDMFIPVGYYGEGKSTFSLYYDVEDESAETGELVLHLRHVRSQSSDEEEETVAETGVYMHYNLYTAIEAYKRANGGEIPSKLVVEYEQKDDEDYEGAVSRTYTFDYKSYVNSYNQSMGNK